MTKICLALIADGLSDLNDHDRVQRTMNFLAPEGQRWRFDPDDPDQIIGWFEAANVDTFLHECACKAFEETYQKFQP